MDDLATYLLDVVQNSISAKSTIIKLTMTYHHQLSIVLEDNGVGIDESKLPLVASPFYTTRTTRKVGLGLSMIQMICEQTEGTFLIESVLNKGTILTLTMNPNHIDMPMIGDLGELIYTISIHQDVNEFLFTYEYQNERFEYVLSEIKAMFQETLTTYDVMKGITEFVNKEIKHIRGEL